ncbi:transposase [Streptomyces sp. NPDC048241]|uniref:transposase n=1 Tax=Streptomyces sp. NPDC048241 TaxID=3365521 RepID=UPI003719284F
MENSQVAVYLVYAGMRGHAAADRELYFPRSWTGDPDRCRAAALGEDTVFATKPELARMMIKRCLDAGHRIGWVTGDEVYGGNPKLRAALEERGWVTCLRWPARPKSPPGRERSAPTRWPRSCPGGPGRSCRPDPTRKATPTMTGPSSTSPTSRRDTVNC